MHYAQRALLAGTALALSLAVIAPTQASTIYGVFRDAPLQSIAKIVAQGDTASVLPNLSAASLAGINVLWILNGNNGAQPAQLISNTAAVDAFVAAGGVFVYNDRNVTGAAGVLPGGGSISLHRDFADSTNINVADNSTILTNGFGPGGVITNSTLDGGNSSSHGYADLASLPFAALGLLSQGNPAHITSFEYKDGLGAVYYSTTPLDYYLQGSGPAVVQSNFDNIYTPNLIAFADTLANPVSEPATFAVLGLGLLGLGLVRRKHS